MSKQEKRAKAKDPIIDHVNTLEEIEVYVKDRKIAQLKRMFPPERESVIDHMFYYYDEKHRRQVGDEEIVLQDEEYIVVRSTRAYNGYRQAYYHGICVIGIDNNIPWIHRLPWNMNFEDDKYRWRNDRIKQLMGFELDVSGPVTGKIMEGFTVRIQGDLTIRKVHESDFERIPVARQLNLRFANHLIIVGNAAISGRRSLSLVPDILVPNTTTCFVIHDEHRNAQIPLTPGVYRFGLLRRHQNG